MDGAELSEDGHVVLGDPPLAQLSVSDSHHPGELELRTPSGGFVAPELTEMGSFVGCVDADEFAVTGDVDRRESSTRGTSSCRRWRR